MYNSKKIIRNIILVSSITIFVMIFLFAADDIDKVWNVIKTANYGYFAAAFGLTLLYFLLWPLTLCILAKVKKCEISFKDTYIIGSTEHFFNGITPFATGGQPFQAYSLSKKNVKLSDSTGLLMMNFIIFMFVSNVYCLLSLIYYKEFTDKIQNINQIVIIGFIINLTIFFMFFSIVTFKKTKGIFLGILRFLCRISIFKKLLEHKIPNFEIYFNDAQAAFKELLHHKKTCISCILIKAATLFIYYAIPFFILKALHVTIGINQCMYVVLGTSFAITMVVWVPTPGASGGIELAFKSIFMSIAGVTTSIALGGMLLWRVLTYYLIMVFGFIGYLILEKKDKKKEFDL